jgi:hypothetical protein
MGKCKLKSMTTETVNRWSFNEIRLVVDGVVTRKSVNKTRIL